MLTNTNRLIRFYTGANGLKTGSTAKAGFCISAAAKRDGMQLIAVVMGSSTRDSRNETAKQMLNWGFANYACIEVNNNEKLTVPVSHGKQKIVKATYESFNLIVEKNQADEIDKQITMNGSVDAPIQKGDLVGMLVCSMDGEMLYEAPIYSIESVEKNTFSNLLVEILKKYFLI